MSGRNLTDHLCGLNIQSAPFLRGICCENAQRSVTCAGSDCRIVFTVPTRPQYTYKSVPGTACGWVMVTSMRPLVVETIYCLLVEQPAIAATNAAISRVDVTRFIFTSCVEGLLTAEGRDPDYAPAVCLFSADRVSRIYVTARNLWRAGAYTGRHQHDFFRHRAGGDRIGGARPAGISGTREPG